MRLRKHSTLAVLLAITAGFAACQAPFAPARPPDLKSFTPETIVDQLIPNGMIPTSLNLNPAERARAIRLLEAAMPVETQERRHELVLYLLISLDHDYALNRNKLLHVWRATCDDGTMELMIHLYEQGRKEFVRPLMEDCKVDNVATDEGLEGFFGDLLAKSPKDFLEALATFPPAKQRQLCWGAGLDYGGGISSATETKVLARLTAIGGDLAQRCARGVEAGKRNRDQEQNESEMQDR